MTAVRDRAELGFAARARRTHGCEHGGMAMLNHVSIGVKDLAKARRFYDATLGALGYKCLYESAEAAGYGSKSPVMWLLPTKSPVQADAKSGLHFCFDAAHREDVDAFHAAALQAGGHDNGKPGLRPDYGENYYAAFVVDPDGYRLEAYCAKAK
jgi:catechol 2,3-dioxygenase-like lactoylglutathione lyase family enzyme